MKSPEAYLEEKVVLPDRDRSEQESPSLEQAFLARYFSGTGGEPPADEPLPEASPEQVQIEPARDRTVEHPVARMRIVEAPPEPVQEQDASEEPEMAHEQSKFVGFFIHGQEYVVPIQDVQEVIKRIPPTRLPLSPDFVSGIINLRSTVTPLVDLARLMGKEAGAVQDKEFIIVCRERGFQLGLEVERISTMYHVESDQIEWSIDAHLEGQNGFLSGLIKGHALIGIIDVKAMAEAVVQGS